MNVTPDNVESLALQKEDENWRFRSFVKGQCTLSDRKLDKMVFEIADQVWASVDCTSCARCCKTLQPTFSKKEQQRVAQRLGLSREQFVEKYLELDQSEDETVWKIRQSPCPFLEKNKCLIYEDRPANCRDYPYVYQSQFSSRMWGMMERTMTCPIVLVLFDKLKSRLGFK